MKFFEKLFGKKKTEQQPTEQSTTNPNPTPVGNMGIFGKDLVDTRSMANNNDTTSFQSTTTTSDTNNFARSFDEIIAEAKHQSSMNLDTPKQEYVEPQQQSSPYMNSMNLAGNSSSISSKLMESSMHEVIDDVVITPPQEKPNKTMESSLHDIDGNPIAEEPEEATSPSAEQIESFVNEPTPQQNNLMGINLANANQERLTALCHPELAGKQDEPVVEIVNKDYSKDKELKFQTTFATNTANSEDKITAEQILNNDLPKKGSEVPSKEDLGSFFAKKDDNDNNGDDAPAKKMEDIFAKDNTMTETQHIPNRDEMRKMFESPTERAKAPVTTEELFNQIKNDEE